ncbi:S-locus-specific glycoprotein S13-like [Malus domestica]|uniref:S-locus-specific glycoprotein S13-like n=1 Tax=Malus domestica TaxID=3750 RepID=UPI003974ECDF
MAAHTTTSSQPANDSETLTSLGGRFELGFFSLLGNPMNRHLGIWYINIPSKVLWTATRNSPLTDLYGKLAIGTNGNLVLLNRNASSIWSSNVSTTPKTRVTQLLDSGNLVLKENTSSAGTYVWQSFDNPFDTLLLSMKISWNINTGSERHLTSRKSIDDPSTSDFSYKIDMKGLPQLVVVMGASAIKYQTRP